MRYFLLPVLLSSCLTAAALGSEPLDLIDPDEPAGGWEFGNGPEFPGATGKLELAREPFRDKPVLSLHGDFTAGGNYVQAWRGLPKTEPGTLSLWVNSPAGSERLPLRFIDAADTCHQINLRLNAKGGWQHLVLPLGPFFRKMGTPDALDIVVRYQSWGAAEDSKKHGKAAKPNPSIAILASRAMGGEKGTLLLSDIRYEVPTPSLAVEKTIRLDEMLAAGELDWGFNLGQEFPGAKGGLELVKDQPEAGSNAMRLHADFTGGGAYVGVRRGFGQLNVEAIKVLRMKMRSDTAARFSIRMVDGSGQCHQRKDISFEADGKWHVVELVPEKIAGGEHWGGANDGTWHDSLRLVELMLNQRSSEGNKVDLCIAEITADVIVEARAQPAAAREDFESDDAAARWQTAGAVRVAGPGHDGSTKALCMERTLEALQTETRATGPRFAVRPGPWQVQYAAMASLHSPDNSYHASVALEALDASGKVIETVPVGIVHGKPDWREVAKTVALPRGAKAARFRVELKKTYGTFWLDGLSAAPLSTGPVERRIERILLATDAVGNLFLPGDEVVFHATVEAIKPLPEAERVLRYSLRDYGGAEQFAPGEIALEQAPRGKAPFAYAAELRLPRERLAVGKFYELHVAVPQEGGESVREFSGLAVLPKAPSRQFEPEQIPFTIRNWDSRVPAYFDLADRLGLRLIGVWGGWKSKPPYKPHCPGIERCEELGAKWITGTPASRVEREGFKEYTEEALRQGMKNFLEQYADRGMAMIALGNEPHGTGEKVLENVRAYKAIYETVKAFDPEIHVIGTSVEPNEEYFRAGYQDYLDSYDFHIYEHYTKVRRTMREYRALMKKHEAVKPIHSTELGLNSQGQTRRAVALEMIKKFTVFFAEGGATASWFTIQYPDPKGKARGQFGDAHCVFDCKYNLYNPRLDAIVHYHVINGLCDKRFVEERQYDDGTQAFLFRDARGGCLQVIWRDEGRRDVRIPLPGQQDVRLVHLDGTCTDLRSTSEGISATVSEEPLLLLYAGEEHRLASELGEPSLRLEAPPAAIRAGGRCELVVAGDGLAVPSLRVECPPLWKAALEQAGEGRVAMTVEAPAATPAREARLYVRRLAGAKPRGVLTVPLQVDRDGRGAGGR